VTYNTRVTAEFIPPSSVSTRLHMISCLGVISKRFHRNWLFSFGRPSARFWPAVSYSTRFSTVFTRGRFHPSIFRLPPPPFAYDSMSWCRFQMFSSKSAVFVLVTRQPVFGLPSAIACGFRLFSSAVVFIPPSSVSTHSPTIPCLGVVSKRFTEIGYFCSGRPSARVCIP
jgi:hypothetical protein